MSQGGVEFARRFFEDFNRQGVDAVLAYFDPAIEWLVPPEWLEEQVYEGHEGLRKLAAAWGENFEDYRLDLSRVIDTGEDEMLVLVHQRGRIKGSDAGIEHRVGFEWQLRDGKIVQVRVHFSWEQAFAAAGVTGRDEHEGLDLVRTGVEAFAAGDLERVATLYAPDARITAVPEGWPEPAPVVGRDAVVRQFARLQEDWKEQSVEIEREFVGGAWVVVEIRWRTRGAGSGMSLDTTVTGAYRVEGGQIAEARFFWNWDDAVADVGRRRS